MAVYRIVRRKPVEPPTPLVYGLSEAISFPSGSWEKVAAVVSFSTGTFRMVGDTRYPDGLYRQNEDGAIEAVPVFPALRPVSVGAPINHTIGTIEVVTAGRSTLPNPTLPSPKPVEPERPHKSLWDHLDDD